MGRENEAHGQAKANIEAWEAEMRSSDRRESLDAIVVTTSGCGTTIKDYGHMLREEPEWADRAAKISALAKDVTEYLTTLDMPAAPEGEQTGIVVAYHAACSLQHGQKVRAQPKALLRHAGYTVREAPEAHLCCGSAGTYNLLQPEIAGELRDRKVRNIRSVKPQVVAAGNIGCLTQIASGIDVPVVHTVKLLDWAYGSERPTALQGVEGQPASAWMEVAE